MKARLLLTALFLFVGVFPATAQATVMTGSDGYFGADSVVIDTVANSEWLKLPLTKNYSRYALAALLATDPAFSGWRFATFAEIRTLYDHAGVQMGYFDMRDYSPAQGYSISDLNAISAYFKAASLLDLLGSNFYTQRDYTSPQGRLLHYADGYLNGIWDSIPNGFRIGFVEMEVTLINDVTTGDVLSSKVYVAGGYGISADHGGNYYQAGEGEFLIKDLSPAPVPEPTTVLLTALGLAALPLLRLRMFRC